MIDLNYVVAVIHKRTKSMALKSAISRTFEITKNHITSFSDNDLRSASNSLRHINYYTDNDAIGASLVMTYGKNEYSNAHKLLEVALDFNPENDIGKLLFSINSHEHDPVRSGLLDNIPGRLNCKELNTLLANYSIEQDRIPESMDFFINSMKNDLCPDSRMQSLRTLNKAAK